MLAQTKEVGGRMAPGYDAKYGTTKLIGALITLFGWIAVIVGIVVLVGGIMAATKGEIPEMIAAAAAGFSFLFILMGLLLAGGGQLIRAMADNANNTGAMLALLKSGNSIT